jgi:hypothetical protein
MGQAKLRGDFEQRKAAALARNEHLEKEFSKLPANHPINQYRKTKTTQAAVVRLIMCGVLSTTTNIKQP